MHYFRHISTTHSHKLALRVDNITDQIKSTVTTTNVSLTHFNSLEINILRMHLYIMDLVHKTDDQQQTYVESYMHDTSDLINY